MIAILIPFHIRGDHLDYCIAELSKLSAEKFQVYFILDGSPRVFKYKIAACGLANFKILEGDGDLFWGGAMRLGMSAAFKHGHSAVLWINDDTRFESHDVTAIYRYHESNPDSILGAQLIAENLGNMEIYSQQNPSLSTVEYLNGNFTLVPRAIFDKIGNINSRKFPHFADGPYFDTARRTGATFVLVPQITVGITYDVLRHLPIKWQYYLGPDNLLKFLKKQFLIKSSKWYIPYRFHYSINKDNNQMLGIIRLCYAFVRDFGFLLFPFFRKDVRKNSEQFINSKLGWLGAEKIQALNSEIHHN